MSTGAKRCPHCGVHRTTRLTWLGAAIIIVIAGFVMVHVLSQHNHAIAATPTEKTTVAHAIVALRSYYKEVPIGGGWSVSSIEDAGRNVNVFVRIPDRQAQEIMSQPSSVQFEASALACPMKNAKVWTILAPEQDIKVHVADSSGIFIDLGCRQWGT